jgi:hypothetical protein
MSHHPERYAMITRVTTEARVGSSHVVLDANLDDSIIHLSINGVTSTFPTVPSGELLDRDPDKQIEGFNTVRAVLEATKAASL